MILSEYINKLSHYKIKGRLKTKCSFRRPFITYTIPTLSLSPVFLLTGFAYTRIEAVGRVEFAVELLERRFSLV